jgi:hypothetical protein
LLLLVLRLLLLLLAGDLIKRTMGCVLRMPGMLHEYS